MHRKTAALFVSLLVLSLTLFSPRHGRAQDRGSQADQEACTPDVFRLCQEFIPNEGSIVACLRAKRAELSMACAPVMFPPTADPPRRGTRG